ncbi:hypothetical protein FJZ31_26880 [Candidatus Poribacteria bacterium]|nr:hypothetical protein [Candidatus Poribacteria bacterium]
MYVEIPYDELWKDVVESLFPCFIKLIAPDFYTNVDWSKPIVFLDDELRQISSDSEETTQYVDRLAHVFLLDGEEKWVLIQVEVQGYRDAEFSERMFIYFYFFPLISFDQTFLFERKVWLPRLRQIQKGHSEYSGVRRPIQGIQAG